jgi:hypothetical protein
MRLLMNFLEQGLGWEKIVFVEEEADKFPSNPSQ